MEGGETQREGWTLEEIDQRKRPGMIGGLTTTFRDTNRNAGQERQSERESP